MVAGEIIWIAAATVVIECAVAVAFGLRRDDLARVAVVNAVTNPLMNLALVVGEAAVGALASPLALGGVEAVVVLAEAGIYRILLRRCRRPFALSLAANAASYLAGAALFGF